LLVKNVVAVPAGATFPFGVSLTMVVPVPWTLLERLSRSDCRL
jgi:hypothetical protein